MQPLPQRTVYNMQPLMSYTQVRPQIEIGEKPNSRERFPVTVPNQPAPIQSYIMHGSRPTTTISNHLMQSVTMKSDMVVGKYLHT